MFVVAVLAVQVGFALNGYRDPHKYFAFQPFNESSTWQADIVRVTWDGRRVPIEGGWAGYQWNELVGLPALRNPSQERHASNGVAATVDYLDEALDWVAVHTPDDTETRYFEATVTTVRNTRPAGDDRAAQRRARAVTSTLVPPARPATRWDAVLDRTGSVRAVAVLRIAIGPIVLLHLRPLLGDALDGVGYDDHFWVPWVSWFHPPDAVWFAMLWAAAAGAVLMTIGLWTRVACAVTFAMVAGNLLVSRTHFHHNRTFLTILLFGLTLLPVGRVLSVDAWRARRRGRPLVDDVRLWPLWLFRVQVSLVYVASGTSKLVDPDWFGGLVMWDRVVRRRHYLEPTPLPGWAIDLLTERWPYYALGPVTVLTELFIGLGLWHRRTRLAAVWFAIAFHVMIEITSSVQVFSYAALAALSIWVTPSTRDRTVRVGSDSAAALVRAADWYARFRVERRGAGEPLTAVDRDGTVRTGRAAAGLVMSRLPVTFPFAAPLRALGGWRR